MDVTLDAPESTGQRGPGARVIPGLLVLMENGRPAHAPLAVPRGGLTLGRGTPSGRFSEDTLVSRSHLTVRHVAGCWVLEDAGSRNGSRVNGEAMEGPTTVASPALIRMGRSVCWAVDDVSPFLEDAPRATNDGPILGGASRQAWQEIAVAARASDTLLLGGPSGAGKELAARAFHEVSHGTGSVAPFIAVNCATIPEGLAERLLFGAKKGAYSGAASDAQGYLHAAHGGTLFLDELAELELSVQAKLLRVLENREFTPLGDTRPRPVQLRVVGASLRDLRERVGEGRFREDLYYRLGRPFVALPPLSARLDELVPLAQRVLAQVDPALGLSASFVEACALRPWPGNVREYIGEVRRAAFAAQAAGVNEISADFLAQDAGAALPTGTDLPRVEDPATASRRKPTLWPSDDAIRSALAEHDGNVSQTARALGLHRNQLRRWLEKN